MKQGLGIIALVFFLLTGCSAADSPGDRIVGLVFDVGGRGDKSFNDAAYRGLELARDSLGTSFVYIEPTGEGADREAALRNLAMDPDIELVFGVGLLFSRDITDAARQFPDKYFACIDYVPEEGVDIPSNLSAIVFEDRKGSFLAGALAAMSSRSEKIGFIGGMDSNIIRRFEEGYRKGARYENPDIEVISGFIGMTGSAFANPSKGREVALGQYAKGVDVIYQAAGASGLGVVEAARETGNLVIGTDMDQSALAPEYVLSTIVKAIDRVVLSTIADVETGSFKGGRVNTYGLDGRFTDYVHREDGTGLPDPAAVSRLEELRKGLMEGSITL